MKNDIIAIKNDIVDISNNILNLPAVENEDRIVVLENNYTLLNSKVETILNCLKTLQNTE